MYRIVFRLLIIFFCLAASSASAATCFLYIEETMNGEPTFFLTKARQGVFVALFEQGQIVFDDATAVCATTSSSVTPPSRRPSVNAKPELVVASALKPSASSTRAEPASHGFGITNGSPSCSAANAAAFSGLAHGAAASASTASPCSAKWRTSPARDESSSLR